MSSLFESSVIKGKMENTENQYIFIKIHTFQILMYMDGKKIS